MRVFATYMLSPADFCVQLESSADTLQNLMDDIRDKCGESETASLSQLSQLCPPDACLARCKDDANWYRAKVINITYFILQ
jgi:hypothetical protein